MKTKSISELTKQEFLDFVVFLGMAPGNTEAENSRWNRKFRRFWLNTQAALTSEGIAYGGDELTGASCG